MLFASPMIGVPPICQSPLGNGGESNGAGGMRRCGGDASDAGGSYAGDAKSFANASIKRCPNQSELSAAFAVVITNAIRQTIIGARPDWRATHIQPWVDSINFLTQTKRHSRDEAPTSRSRISRLPLPFNDADEVSCRAGAIKCSRCRASFAPIRTAFADGIWFPRWTGHSPIH